MDSLSKIHELSFSTGGIFAVVLVCISILTRLARPGKRYNKAKVVRVSKTTLQSWLTWDTPPYLSLGKYIKEGYYSINKPLGKPFAIPMCGMENTILPPKYLSVLKGEDRKDLSLCQGFEDMFNMTVTTGKAGRHDIVEIDVVATYINPRLSQLLPHMLSQTDYAFDLVVGDKPEWKKFNTADLCFDLVFAETARVLVGEELCRNPAYIKAIINYSKSFLMSGFMWPIRPPNWGPIRDFFYWLFTWGLRRDVNRVFEFLIPLINRRLQELETSKKSEGGKEEHIDLIQGLLQMKIPEAAERTPLRHAHRVIHLSFAASAVSSALMMHTFHQMLMTPEHIPALREEITNALKENGGWTEKALLEMRLLDSTIRELLRLNPPSVFVGQRTIMSPTYRFDDTLTLPAKTRIAFPVMEIHTDQDNYPEPMRFNPYRFIGSGPGAEGAKAASRITEDYLAFGYGKQACPGRFLAIRQMKLILAKLFLNYEFQWAGGPTKAPKKLNRQIVEGQIFPDMSTKVEIRKRLT
ncbi:cytochrome P450 monooxygenase-like protein [Delitschia confertaspora ATCC 74209]|uniref:Cytochrome P450 monooxygenase-like protein n=1 Tax=Delitschia confertaspora ATCC 74209 TaxID=1513339 RepID=A0A9P4MSE9_9PLEO|nr:cytochrome P450 monooxygenase-like protein [Delitschia confertaspora ATCC 74209]